MALMSAEQRANIGVGQKRRHAKRTLAEKGALNRKISIASKARIARMTDDQRKAMMTGAHVGWLRRWECMNDSERQIFRDAASTQKTFQNSSLELEIARRLISLNASFERQVKIESFRVDFVVEGTLIIEANGCYWHGCPLHYPDEAKIESDSQRISQLEKSMPVIVIWEHDMGRSYFGSGVHTPEHVGI
jgi:very-short-patch-repair endonuclease